MPITVVLYVQCAQCAAVKLAGGTWLWPKRRHLVLAYIERGDWRYGVSHGICPRCLPAMQLAVATWIATERVPTAAESLPLCGALSSQGVG